MIYIGADHGGFALKQEIKKYLDSRKLKFKDLGTYSEDSCDYPDYARQVAQAVAKEEGSTGILVCGTGIGMSIAANKVKGVRAAVTWSLYTAEMARKHNNANVLCLGGRVLDKELALSMVETFLRTEFEGGRHENRVKKIGELEK